MKKHLIFPILFAVLFLTGSSCKRSFDRDYAGPLICPTDNFAEAVGHSFTVTSVSTASPANLSSVTEAVLITDQFNESVSWTVRIKGSITGAVKNYTGTSNQ